MQKRWLGVTGILLAAGAVSLINAADFRTVGWGMGISTVKKVEVAKLVEENEQELIYNTTLGGVAVVVRYTFEDGKLVAARYEFVKQYRESEKYAEAFEMLQAQLEKKYGKPASREVVCADEFYRDFPRRWGTGIVVGKLSQSAQWSTERVLVRHEIRALPGGSVGHYVEYRPKTALRGELQSDAIYSAL